MKPGLREIRRYNPSDFDEWEADLTPFVSVDFGAEADATEALAKAEGNGLAQQIGQLIK